MAFLLDSNAVIDLMAQHPPMVVRVKQKEPGTLFLASIVWFELMYGAYNSQRQQDNLRRLGDLNLPFLPFDEDDARAAGEVRAILRRVGTPIGPYDVQIAGQALARGMTLVTNNTEEFARVDGLRLEDWRQA